MFEDFSTFVDQFELILESQDPAFKRIENYRRLFQVKPATEEAKLIDEAIESALIRVVKKNWVKFRDDFDSLIKLYNFAPRLAVRTSDSIRRQAFSTPIPISALASKLLDCTPESTVYEPTAGMGALLLDANPKYTQVNEIDHLRAWVLAQQEFDQVTSFDATTWYPDQSFDRVISNPPFGKMKLIGAMKRPYLQYLFPDEPKLDLKELDEIIPFVALNQLKPDGKAVLIIKSVLGSTPEARMEKYRSNTDRVKFFDLLFRYYGVTKYLTLGGDLYQKQGASYPVDLIVIDKKEPSNIAKPNEEVPLYINKYDDLSLIY